MEQEIREVLETPELSSFFRTALKLTPEQVIIATRALERLMDGMSADEVARLAEIEMEARA